MSIAIDNKLSSCSSSLNVSGTSGTSPVKDDGSYPAAGLIARQQLQAALQSGASHGGQVSRGSQGSKVGQGKSRMTLAEEQLRELHSRTQAIEERQSHSPGPPRKLPGLSSPAPPGPPYLPQRQGNHTPTAPCFHDGGVYSHVQTLATSTVQIGPVGVTPRSAQSELDRMVSPIQCAELRGIQRGLDSTGSGFVCDRIQRGLESQVSTGSGYVVPAVVATQAPPVSSPRASPSGYSYSSYTSQGSEQYSPLGAEPYSARGTSPRPAQEIYRDYGTRGAEQYSARGASPPCRSPRAAQENLATNSDTVTYSPHVEQIEYHPESSQRLSPVISESIAPTETTENDELSPPRGKSPDTYEMPGQTPEYTGPRVLRRGDSPKSRRSEMRGNVEAARETCDSLYTGMREVEQYIVAYENENHALKSKLLIQRARVLHRLFLEDAYILIHGIFVAWWRSTSSETRTRKIQMVKTARCEDASVYEARIRELELVLASQKNHFGSQLTAALGALLPMKVEAQALERRAQSCEKLIQQIAEATGANPHRQRAHGSLSEQIGGLRQSLMESARGTVM